jgi:hypothetical protein
MKTTFTIILILLITALNINAQVSKTIDVATPGTLTTLLSEGEKTTITDLTVTGTIDARDIKTMRDEITLLQNLILTNTSIAEYTGAEPGTAYSSYHNPTYPVNVFPMYSFAWNTTLVTISLPESITTIASHAFLNCTNLITVIPGNQLIKIESQAFYAATKLNHIVLPESLEIIADASFASCLGLNSIHIPASVIEIMDSAFGRDCPAYITVEESNPNYSATNGYLLNKDKTILVSATALYESYEVPESVTELFVSAFYMNTKIKTLTLPENLTLIEYSGLDGCTNLRTIYCKAVNPPSVRDFSLRNIPRDGTLYVPIGSRDAYMAASQWGEFQNIVETDFTTSLDINNFQNTVVFVVNRTLHLQNVSSHTEVKVYSLTGQLISSFSTRQTTSVALPKGIYLVKVDDSCHKVIIQ